MQVAGAVAGCGLLLAVVAAGARAVPPGADGRIAFQASDSDSSDIWAMNANGTGVTNMTATPDADDFEPSWSPDGRRIAFTSVPRRRSGRTDGGYVTSSTGDVSRRLNALGISQTSPRGGRTGHALPLAFALVARPRASAVPVPRLRSPASDGGGLRFVTRPLRSVNAVDSKPHGRPTAAGSCLRERSTMATTSSG